MEGALISIILSSVAADLIVNIFKKLVLFNAQ